MQISFLLLGTLPAASCFPALLNIGTSRLVCVLPSAASSLLGPLGVDSQCLLTEKHFEWTAPGPGDLRSPCPALNTLANHGFIPHDGRNITLEVAQKGFKESVNYAPDMVAAAYNGSLVLNPGQNFINLDMLNKHNVIEHDGSLSRRDMNNDTSNNFDDGTWNSFLSYFGSATTMEVASIANARARHVQDMSRINPNFTLNAGHLGASVVESAFLLTMFGSAEKPVAQRNYVDFFFRTERLPVELGWTPSDTPITLDPVIMDLSKSIKANSPAGVPLFGESK